MNFIFLSSVMCMNTGEYRFRCAPLRYVTIMVSPWLTHFRCLLLACTERLMLH